MIDKFLNKIFAFSRVIAAFGVLLCLIIVTLGGLYFLISGSENPSKPDFDDYIEATDEYSELAERRSVEKKYGDDIEDILKLGKFDKDVYDDLIEGLVEEIDEEYRSTFVNGFKRFLQDGAKYIEKNGEGEFGFYEIADGYFEMFESEIMEAEMSKIESKAKRTNSLIAIGSALVAMILFLGIPLLLQIELNTRKDPQVEKEEIK